MYKLFLKEGNKLLNVFETKDELTEFVNRAVTMQAWGLTNETMLEQLDFEEEGEVNSEWILNENKQLEKVSRIDG